MDDAVRGAGDAAALVSRRDLAGLVGTVLLAVGAGAATWVGAVVVGAPLPLGPAMVGALNVVTVAWLSLAAALLALGWAPNIILPVGAIPVAGGFLLQVLAESLHWPDWVMSLSPYDHLNAVPYENVDWAGAAGMTLVAVALGWIGLAGFTTGPARMTNLRPDRHRSHHLSGAGSARRDCPTRPAGGGWWSSCAS